MRLAPVLVASLVVGALPGRATAQPEAAAKAPSEFAATAQSQAPAKAEPATVAAAPDSIAVEELVPLRIEPGLEDRRQRYRRSAASHVAMVPAYVLRFPFQVINYPIENWLVHKEPGALSVYARQTWARLRFGGVAGRIGGLGSGSGTGAGLSYRLPLVLTLGKPLTVSGSWTYLLYEQYAVQLDSLDIGPVPTSLRVRYGDRPQEDFWGLGPRSNEGDRSTYRLEETVATWTLVPPLGRGWVLPVWIGASRSDLSPGRDPDFPDSQDIFDPAVYEGLTGRYEFLEFGTGLVFDTRDVKTYARRGRYLTLGVQHAEGIRDTPSEFTKFTLEAQQFLPLPGYRRALALRFRTVLTDNRAQGHSVPVFRLESVGSSRTVRGYQTFRFTEEDALLGSVEYRFPVWTIEPQSLMALDGALFFDFGTALRDMGRVQQRDLRSGGGFGLRIVSPRGSIGRMDVAFTPEGIGLHFTLHGGF